MKIKRIVILICLMIILLVGMIWYRHIKISKGYCTDENILSLLSNDSITPEFVLDNQYYVLPIELSDLMQKGWGVELAYYTEDGVKSIRLLPEEFVYVRLCRNSDEITAIILNLTDEVSDLYNPDLTIGMVRVATGMMGATDGFVTKHGIRPDTSAKNVKKALEKHENFQNLLWDWDKPWGALGTKNEDGEYWEVLHIDSYNKREIAIQISIDLSPYQPYSSDRVKKD